MRESESPTVGDGKLAVISGRPDILLSAVNVVQMCR